MSSKLTTPTGLDPSVLNDINGHIFPDIQDFYESFFANRPWTSIAEEFVQKLPHFQKQIDFRLQTNIVTWLTDLQASLAERTTLYCSWHEHTTESSPTSDQILVLADSASLKTEVKWDDLAVLGLFSQGSRWEGILQLCAYARSVFSSQPSRAFLHSFLVRGEEAELWQSDRSGIYGSTRLTVTDTNDQYLSAIVGYMLMDSSEWGMSSLVHRNEQDECASFSYKHGTEVVTNTYILGAKIFERGSGHLVSDGLTVYRARRVDSPGWNYAIKFKWSKPSERHELTMLNLLKERNVWGVIRLDAHHDGVNTEMLHDGLTLNNSINLQAEGDGSYVEIKEYVTESSGENIRDEPKTLICTVVTPEGRSLHKYESILEVLYALRDAAKAHRSLYQKGRILHRDINPSNIIIPSCEPNRDAADTAKGVLIDFDMAKEISEPQQPHQAVGTYIFQAIGVLQAYLPDNPHTYRHDLESFFYTFLFLAVTKRPVPEGENQLQLPTSSVLREWTKGRLFDKANRKIQDMESAKEFSRRIVAEFTPDFQGLGALAEKLRAILFPVKEDGVIWTRTDMTDQGTNALYDAVIGAFEDAALEPARL
ncbi:hypothetical protein J7T55_011041 [Diaporthe amygdali]|uniref:uncharacterized protein n=1 Tax=Phomopsis amygdali TaxID=1214568 RepID=UPI0022FE3864|nr:uncharacterized protein J7T55_011041 [Diaporthe amygdali]KAJ0106946.1 hypothetical protein J7T55_011041 [Diaporthe amygdali]